MSFDLKQSTSAVAHVGPFIQSANGSAHATGLLAPTNTIWLLNGTAFLSNYTPTYWAEVALGYYSVGIPTTNVATTGRLTLGFAANSSNLACWHDFHVLPAAFYDSRYSSGTVNANVMQVNGVAGGTIAANLTQWLGTAPLTLASQYVQVDVERWKTGTPNSLLPNNNLPANFIDTTFTVGSRVSDSNFDLVGFDASQAGQCCLIWDTVSGGERQVLQGVIVDGGGQVRLVGPYPTGVSNGDALVVDWIGASLNVNSNLASSALVSGFNTNLTGGTNLKNAIFTSTNSLAVDATGRTLLQPGTGSGQLNITNGATASVQQGTVSSNLTLVNGSNVQTVDIGAARYLKSDIEAMNGTAIINAVVASGTALTAGFLINAPAGTGGGGTNVNVIAWGGSDVAEMIVGGSGTNAQWSTKALALGPSGGGGFGGPSTVTLSFVDASSQPVANVNFRVIGVGSDTTDASGIIAFGLPNGNYTVSVTPQSTVIWANQAIVVSGNTSVTLTGATISPPSPPSTTTAVVRILCVDNALNPIPGTFVEYVVDGSGTNGYGFRGGRWQRSNATGSNGLADCTVPVGYDVQYRIDFGTPATFQATSSATFNITLDLQGKLTP